MMKNMCDKCPSKYYNILNEYKSDTTSKVTNFFLLLSETLDLTYDDINKMNTAYNYNIDDSYDASYNYVITELSNILDRIAKIKEEITQETKNIINNNQALNFASTLNRDYTEIFKYNYLKNWGIFLSLISGGYLINKIK